MAKKVQGLRRVLDPTSIASVAYGEIGSSIFFALGVVALQALGFTPWVLLAAGVVFTLVAVSYAEGTAAIPETGGAATFVRRAFNDPAGFITGWVLFLDYLIVIALAGLFVAHYLGKALGWEALTDSPWDVVVAIGVIVLLGIVRLVRRARPLPARRGGCRACVRHPLPDRRARLRVPLLDRMPSPAASTSAERRPGARSHSRFRWRCSRTRAWRRWRTSLRRRASPAAPCRGAFLPVSGSRS